MELNANTRQIKEYGNELLSINDKVSEEIELLYSKLNNIFVDGAWQGVSANRFYQKLAPEKVELTNFNKEFRKYGTQLVKCSEKLESIAKKYR